MDDRDRKSGPAGRVDISDWIARWASWRPEQTALRVEERRVTYGELERKVASVAAWLSGSGVLPGNRVAFLGSNSPELVELLFACARLGAIFVPLSPQMLAAELQVFVKATRPRLLIAAHEFQDLARDSAGGLGPESVKRLPRGDQLAGLAPTAPIAADSGIDAAAPVLILFTSGTTGSAKGATFTHQNLAFGALNVITAFGIAATDEVLTAVPMFHAGGLLIHTLPGLCAGATITIHRQFDPGRLLEEIQQQRISLFACVPAMTVQLASHPGWKGADLSSLRLVVTGSTTVPRWAIESWQAKGVSIAQGYGMTETCVIATTMPPGSPPESAFTAGKPTIHTQIRVVDQAGGDAATGEPGEVWFRGPAVMQGYWQDEPATREAFHDGWLRSADLGLIDQHGYLHIIDRIKDIIIVGSANICPNDLEAILDACPDIREAAVVGRPDDQRGEVPVAFIVPTPGHTLTPQQVLGLFDRRLAGYKHPREVIFVDQLPRNATGKVDRPRLRELAAQPPGAPHPGTAPTKRTPATHRS